MRPFYCLCILPFLLLFAMTCSVMADERSDYIRSHYTKMEVRIPMRDGKRLFTSIYVPNDLDVRASYPILLSRTPIALALTVSTSTNLRLDLA